MFPNRARSDLEQRTRAPVESPCHADARKLLTDHNITVDGIVRVNPDSILYLGTAKRPFIAWLWRTADRKLEIAYEPGFPAEATPGLVPRHILQPEGD